MRLKYAKVDSASAYNHLLLDEMREKIILFVNRHGYAITEVAFQCDADCRDFIKENGLRYTDEGNAYMLSDIVAWENKRSRTARNMFNGPYKNTRKELRIQNVQMNENTVPE